MPNQPSNKMLITGVAGSIVAAICCFTPALVILLGAVGLSAAVGYLDFVLLPALFIFIGITVYALCNRRPVCCEENKSTFPGKTK